MGKCKEKGVLCLKMPSGVRPMLGEVLCGRAAPGVCNQKKKTGDG